MVTVPMKPISILAVCVLVLGCQSPDGAKVANIDHSSPKSVVVSLQVSLLQKDYAAIAACVEPDLRAECRRMSSSDKRYWEKGLALEGLVQRSFGGELGKAFRVGVFDPFARIFSGTILWNDPQGKTDPNRMTLGWDGAKTAQIIVDGEKTPILARNVRGKWYVGYSKKRDFRGDAKILRDMLDDLAIRFDLIAKGIHNGVIDKSNASDFLGLKKRPPGMPPSRAVVTKRTTEVHVRPP